MSTILVILNDSNFTVTFHCKFILKYSQCDIFDDLCTIFWIPFSWLQQASCKTRLWQCFHCNTVTSFQRGTAWQKGSNTISLNLFADNTVFKIITLAISPVNCNHWIWHTDLFPYYSEQDTKENLLY